ncbi:MAG: translation elongation factor Ts [Cyclobacteriaceae bacterium]|nr:translation elongation factor Ts [Cyclobacteriaceae bacterium]
MNITAQDVNKLRQMTGAGMMDCKKALVEANGDFEQAIDLLRKKGQKVSASRADRETTEGAVFVKSTEDFSRSVLIALNCETDFVAKNEDFVKLGNQILDIAFAEKPENIEALMNCKMEDLTVGEKLTEWVGKIGEKLEVSSYINETGEAVIPYIHAGSKLGVLVVLTGAEGKDLQQVGKDVGMQIAAMNPIGVDKDDVDATVIEKELQIGREQALEEGKPQNIIDKIAEGKLQKFFKDNTLLNQAFVKENSLTVAKYLQSVAPKLTVTKFYRVSIG